MCHLCSKNSVLANLLEKRFQKCKIESEGLFEIRLLFSLFLMRKPLPKGQKWFLRPYFPVIRDIFVLKSGLRFSFRGLEVPNLRVRKRQLQKVKVYLCSEYPDRLNGISSSVAYYLTVENYSNRLSFLVILVIFVDNISQTNSQQYNIEKYVSHTIS